MEILIDHTIPIFTEYFHALTLTDPTDIFNTTVTTFTLTPDPTYKSYDVVDKLITPLANASPPVLPTDGHNRLVPMQGVLITPDTPATGRVPLVVICHGNHAGYAGIDGKTHENDPPGDREYIITVPSDGDQVPSYLGYLELQRVLATQGIASYSINLNIVNTLDNNEHDPFNKQALDFNQRILLFFHHLKLLKTLAGESVNEPAGADALPLRFLKGTSFVNLRDELASASPNTDLVGLRSVLANRIDYTRLGIMGHSRGADTVSRIPAYFHRSTPFTDPVFPWHPVINARIRNLCVQIGSPVQEHIRCILALQPTATQNTTAPANHGYIIDNPRTMFFVGLGTHDEDVSLDPVRIYEYPTCPKAMITINGASHKGFNTVWAGRPDKEELGWKDVKLRLIAKPTQQEILKSVFGTCFTATLTNNSAFLKYFTKEFDFPVLRNNAIDIQCAWKFGFPFGGANVMNDLDPKVSGISKSSLSGTGFPFEQRINAFIEKRENAGVFTIQIPIDPASDNENLSRHTHFSFRFARGYKLGKKPDREEVKNFTIEFFDNNTRTGKTIEGKDIASLKLKALRAFDEKEKAGEDKKFEYSILMQTVEVSLQGKPGLNTVNRIEIKVVTDPTKDPPRSALKVKGGSLAVGVLSGGLGVGGALYLTDGSVEGNNKWLVIASGVGFTALGAGIMYSVLKSEENAFAFTDFVLTNRQI